MTRVAARREVRASLLRLDFAVFLGSSKKKRAWLTRDEVSTVPRIFVTHMHADMHDVVSLLPDRSGLSFLNLEVRLIYVQVDSFSFVRS